MSGFPSFSSVPKIMQFNWIDLVVLIVLGWFVWDGWKKGIFWLAAQLVAFLLSLVIAFRSYAAVAGLIVQLFSLSHGWAKAIAFMGVAIVAEQVIYEFLAWVVVRVPKRYVPKWWAGFMGVVPSLINGGVFVAFVATAVVSLPVRPQVKRAVLDSRLGNWLVARTVGAEQMFAGVFGDAARETLTFLTTPVGSGERVDLGFKVEESGYRVDPEGERQIFDLVNEERRKEGLAELEWYPEAVEVARGHSRDMVGRGYFSHNSPEGDDVGDRLQKSGITYVVAGENLALAPTIQVAHDGLMNSPGHRANILSPEFSRAAIGVIDSGVYGKMVTQVFLN